MTVTVYPSRPKGCVKAISSKSVAHRLLICAAFADAPSSILCEEINKDIEATVACLSALGAKIKRDSSYYTVEPISADKVNKNAVLHCGESGSTLRFLIPVVSALGCGASFVMEGRLPERPLSPLREELEAHGIDLSFTKANVLKISGALVGADFSIAGNVSSQFVSGMLFAMALLPHPCRLCVTERIESAPYIDLTADALALFGVTLSRDGSVFTSSACGRLIAPDALTVEGDWSNAAFPLCLGVMGGGEVTVTDLLSSSSQGDRIMIDLIRRFGGDIAPTADGNGYVARASRLHACEIDATQIPDLVPILATLASVAEGETRIYGAARLRLKESDRLQSVSDMLNSLGADVRQTDDGLVIKGVPELKGGRVSSCNDHRIAMSAAVAACVCRCKVIIDGAEATAKSYPSFWSHINSLGVSTEDTEC